MVARIKHCSLYRIISSSPKYLYVHVKPLRCFRLRTGRSAVSARISMERRKKGRSGSADGGQRGSFVALGAASPPRLASASPPRVGAGVSRASGESQLNSDWKSRTIAVKHWGLFSGLGTFRAAHSCTVHQTYVRIGLQSVSLRSRWVNRGCFCLILGNCRDPLFHGFGLFRTLCKYLHNYEYNSFLSCILIELWPYKA